MGISCWQLPDLGAGHPCQLPTRLGAPPGEPRSLLATVVSPSPGTVPGAQEMLRDIFTSLSLVDAEIPLREIEHLPKDAVRARDVTRRASPPPQGICPVHASSGGEGQGWRLEKREELISLSQVFFKISLEFDSLLPPTTLD